MPGRIGVIEMFRLWKRTGPAAPRKPAKIRALAVKPQKATAERRMRADTDGAQRRQRQLVEDNRLL